MKKKLRLNTVVSRHEEVTVKLEFSGEDSVTREYDYTVFDQYGHELDSEQFDFEDVECEIEDYIDNYLDEKREEEE